MKKSELLKRKTKEPLCMVCERIISDNKILSCESKVDDFCGYCGRIFTKVQGFHPTNKFVKNANGDR